MNCRRYSVEESEAVRRASVPVRREREVGLLRR